MPGNVVESHIRRRQKPFRLGELQLHSIGKKILTFFKTIWTDAPYLEKKILQYRPGRYFPDNVHWYNQKRHRLPYWWTQSRLQYVINNTGLDRKSCIFEIAESADHTDFAVDVKFFQIF